MCVQDVLELNISRNMCYNILQSSLSSLINYHINICMGLICMILALNQSSINYHINITSFWFATVINDWFSYTSLIPLILSLLHFVTVINDWFRHWSWHIWNATPLFSLACLRITATGRSKLGKWSGADGPVLQKRIAHQQLSVAGSIKLFA
jgi:hypothetical protein